jgi:hypothetical protein
MALPLAYDVRHKLQLFSRLRAVDWQQEPRVHPGELESWYLYQAIDAKRAKADPPLTSCQRCSSACRHLDTRVWTSPRSCASFTSSLRRV